MLAAEEADNYHSLTLMTHKDQLPQLDGKKVQVVELELPGEEVSEEQRITDMKGLGTLEKFISCLDRTNSNLATLFSYLEDHVDLVKSDGDMAQLFHDFYWEIPPATLEYLQHLPEADFLSLLAMFDSEKSAPKMGRRTSLLPQESHEEAPSGREQIPFTFNTQ